MTQNKTIISFSFKGFKRPKRKSSNQSIRLDELDGHITLTDDQAEIYFQKARDILKAENWSVNGFNLGLKVNFAKIDGEMLFVDLYPVQQKLFSKGLSI